MTTSPLTLPDGGVSAARRGYEEALPRRLAAGFWLVAFAYLATMAFATVPTPLYPLYQQQLGFSTFTITIVFAVYAVGVLGSLFLAGHLSDWIGRRKALLIALAIQLIAAALFLLEPALPVLIAGRFTAGLGVGMLTATATAYLHELHRAARPDAGAQRFEAVSTAANVGGLGVGPLIAGILAQYAAFPLFTPYLLLGLVVVLAAVAVARVPETVVPRSLRGDYRPQRVRAERSNPTAYAAALAGGFTAFAVLGVFSSLAPGFLAGVLDLPSPALAGLVTFAVFGGAAAAQILTARLSARRRGILGMAAQVAGLLGLTAGMQLTSLVLFLLGGVLSGVGSGVLFKAAVGSVAAMSPPARRGEALAGLFLVAYLGLALPTVGVGVATLVTSGTVAITWLAAALIGVLAIVAVLELRSPVPASPPAAAERNVLREGGSLPETSRDGARLSRETGPSRAAVLALTGISPEAALFAASSSEAERRLTQQRARKRGE